MARDQLLNQSIQSRDGELHLRRRLFPALGAATTDEERAALYAELTDARKAHVASLKAFNDATRARTRAINAATKAAADAWRAEKAARNAERLAALARSVGISPATISAYALSEGDISRNDPLSQTASIILRGM